MPLRQIRGVRRQLVSDDAVLYVLLVRKSEMLFWCHIAEHRRSKPTDHRRANGRRDVIVTGSDVGRQWTERVERGFMASLELLVHVLFDQVHRHVAGTLDH